MKKLVYSSTNLSGIIKQLNNQLKPDYIAESIPGRTGAVVIHSKSNPTFEEILHPHREQFSITRSSYRDFDSNKYYLRGLDVYDIETQTKVGTVAVKTLPRNTNKTVYDLEDSTQYDKVVHDKIFK